jgi:hypothetical protein
VEDLTLPQVAKKLEKYIMTLPAAKQFNTLGTEPRKAMMALESTSYDLRINTERYFHADDSAEQHMFLSAAIEYADLLNQQILAASQHDLLGPADVAHLSALAEHIKERLE